MWAAHRMFSGWAWKALTFHCPESGLGGITYFHGRLEFLRCLLGECQIGEDQAFLC